GRYAVADSATCGALRRLQDAAVDDVIASKGLSVGDGMVDAQGRPYTGADKLAHARGLALRDARDDVRATMWLRVVAAIKRTDAQRTDDEKLIVAWFTAIVKQYRSDVAEETL